MIIITGGAGFIGSNLVAKLNEKGWDEILIVDNFTDGTKFANLIHCNFVDYEDKEDFLASLQKGKFSHTKIDAIFHLGACTNTTEWDGRYMLKNNYEYSKILLNYCQHYKIPFLYASSAAIYGINESSAEIPINEQPLNVYGYSKLLFDQYIRRTFPIAKSQIAGFRFFNVYGPHEQHKKTMASMVYHFYNQLNRDGILNLFEGHDGYADGDQRRDFVYVEDIVDLLLWFWEQSNISGIYNVGTGNSRTFNAVAKTIIDHYGRGKIKYIPFPEHLKGRYQNFTEANLNNLRKAGYDKPFKSIEEGIKKYLLFLDKATINTKSSN